jgi:hypothetical protein
MFEFWFQFFQRAVRTSADTVSPIASMGWLCAFIKLEIGETPGHDGLTEFREETPRAKRKR